MKEKLIFLSAEAKCRSEVALLRGLLELSRAFLHSLGHSDPETWHRIACDRVQCNLGKEIAEMNTKIDGHVKWVEEWHSAQKWHKANAWSQFESQWIVGKFYVEIGSAPPPPITGLLEELAREAAEANGWNI
jgi:hypothetical protein